MVFETWVMSIYAAIAGGSGEMPFPAALLRMFRLLRLSRSMRMMRNFPELMILIKGMLTAMSACIWVMVLQVLVTYVFAIVFTMLCGEADAGMQNFFANIAVSMWS